MTEVEFRIVNERELPPIVITMDEEDNPKVVLNAYYKVWLGLHRKTIGGCAQSLFDKVSDILDSYLTEQRHFERMDENEV